MAWHHNGKGISPERFANLARQCTLSKSAGNLSVRER